MAKKKNEQTVEKMSDSKIALEFFALIGRKTISFSKAIFNGMMKFSMKMMELFSGQ